MKKNFIQRHTMLVALILFCFLLVPAVRDSYALEKEKGIASDASGNQKDSGIDTAKAQEADKKKVVIDPGHGGYDSGSTDLAEKVREKDITLSIALKVGEILEKEGIEVIYTRESDSVSWTNDNDQDLLARSKIANDSKADFFVSIHMNYSEVTSEEVRGSEVWVSHKNSENVKLAENVNKELNDLNYTINRGLKDEAMSPLSLLRFNDIPSILIETAFLTNKQDTAYVTSEAGQDAIAGAIAQGILASF